MNAWKELDADQVRARVQEVVDRENRSLSDYRFVVRAVRPSESLEEWVLFVDVEPEEGVSGTDYARRLVEMEDKLTESGLEGIALLPVLYNPD